MKKIDRKKHELEVSTLDKIFVDKIFRQAKVMKFFMGDENFVRRKILSDIFLSDKVRENKLLEFTV